MSFLTVIQHTPVWVWLLFAFLLLRGIRALKPREASTLRMFVLPIIFFAWSGYGIFTGLHRLPVALGGFTAALIIGVMTGWLIAQQLQPAIFVRTTSLIYRPGTPWILFLVLAGFASKYALSVAIATHPALAFDTDFNGLYGLTSGLVDGIFWGIVVQQLMHAYRYRTI